MIRIATFKDAEILETLNAEFNGKGETTLKNIIEALSDNPHEIVILDEEDEKIVGFVCVQLKKSFCYDKLMPEITEVYVKKEYRRRGIASEMILFCEKYCADKFSIDRFELLTGKNNLKARALYKKLGYTFDGEVHLSKKI